MEKEKDVYAGKIDIEDRILLLEYSSFQQVLHYITFS